MNNIKINNNKKLENKEEENVHKNSGLN